MTEALYFPNLSLPGSAWVNPSLLYFDRVGVIAPAHPRPDLFDERTQILIGEGLVEPIAPYAIGRSAAADDRFIGMICGMAAYQKRSTRMARIHVEKLAYTRIAEGLSDAGLMQRAEGDWLECPDWVGLHVMSYLAMQIALSAETPLSLVTDDAPQWTSMTGSSVTPRSRARRFKAATSLLPVPANAPAQDIAAFKRRNEHLLRDFRDYVDRLVTVESHDLDGDFAFQARLDSAKRIRAEIAAKIGERNWGATGVSVAIAAAPMLASALEHSPLSAGAGLISLGAVLWSERERYVTAREARTSPLCYAALASMKFQPRSGGLR